MYICMHNFFFIGLLRTGHQCMSSPVNVFSVCYCMLCSYRCGKVFSSFEPARVSQRLRLWRTTRPPCWRGRLALDSGVLFIYFLSRTYVVWSPSSHMSPLESGSPPDPSCPSLHNTCNISKPYLFHMTLLNQLYYCPCQLPQSFK